MATRTHSKTALVWINNVVVIPGLVAKLLAFAGELPPRRIALEINRLLLGRT